MPPSKPIARSRKRVTNSAGSRHATGTNLAATLPALRSLGTAAAPEALPKRCGTTLDFSLPSSFFARCFSRSVYFMLMDGPGVD